MPFTVTHVAAAVPIAWLCRWRVPFSALAIGTMVPDLAGFYPNLLEYRSTHSVVGILTHCTPIGLVGYYVYHALAKRPLVDLLPKSASDRLRSWSEEPIDFSLLAILVATLCVAVGAATHVAWDGFTHSRQWGVELVPQLQTEVAQYGRRQVKLFVILQHGSSVVLLPPLLIGFVLWIRRQPIQHLPLERAQMPRGISWTVIGLMLLGSILYFQTLRDHNPYLLWIGAVRLTVKHVLAVAMVVALLYCLAMHFVWWRERSRLSPEE
jgi:Domain of unknown function (DUF4184)